MNFASALFASLPHCHKWRKIPCEQKNEPGILVCHGLSRLAKNQQKKHGHLHQQIGSKYRYTNTWSFTLWLFNIANGTFIDDFPIKTTIYSGFSMAMLNNQMDPDGISSRHKFKQSLQNPRVLSALVPVSCVFPGTSSMFSDT